MTAAPPVVVDLDRFKYTLIHTWILTKLHQNGGMDRPVLVTSTLGGAPGLKTSTSGEIGPECASKLVHLRHLQCQYFFLFFRGLLSCLKVGRKICSVQPAATSLNGLGMAVMRVIFCPSLTPHRFSAFWLRSKCSICSYQLNI